MSLPIQPPFPPMEAVSVPKIPQGAAWQYEPKWDGFRCLIFRDGKKVHLQSKSGQPLARYFPEVVEAASALPAEKFVLDGELAIAVGDRFSFNELLLRLHPAASRVQKLALAHPAVFIAFDLLVDVSGKTLVHRPLRERRPLLEQFAHRCFQDQHFRLSPATAELGIARKWFASAGSDLDGVIAKRLDMEYRSGDRSGMEKIKPVRTADCVVGGFRYAAKKRILGSLLLGLYDADGLLQHVGFCSSFKAAEKKGLLAKITPLIHPPGFTGKTPGGPSRWNSGRSSAWEPLQSRLVVEVEYDHFTGGRFRHGTKLVRWRPDKTPRLCRMDQVTAGGHASLRLLLGGE